MVTTREPMKDALMVCSKVVQEVDKLGLRMEMKLGLSLAQSMVALMVDWKGR
jgi:hypothetical protein